MLVRWTIPAAENLKRGLKYRHQGAGVDIQKICGSISFASLRAVPHKPQLLQECRIGGPQRPAPNYGVAAFPW
jgi:hypothetical protein